MRIIFTGVPFGWWIAVMQGDKPVGFQISQRIFDIAVHLIGEVQSIDKYDIELDIRG